MPHPVESGSKLRILNTEVQILYGVLMRYNKKVNKVLQKMRADIRKGSNIEPINNDRTKVRILWDKFWNIEDILQIQMIDQKTLSSRR